MKNKNFGNLFFTCVQKRFQAGKHMCQIATSGGRLNRHRQLSTRLNYYPKIFYILFTIFILTSLIILSPILFGRSPLLTHGATMYTISLNSRDGEFKNPLPEGWVLDETKKIASKQFESGTAIGTMPTPTSKWGDAFISFGNITESTIVNNNSTYVAKYDIKHVLDGGEGQAYLTQAMDNIFQERGGYVLNKRDGKYLIESEGDLHFLSYSIYAKYNNLSGHEAFLDYTTADILLETDLDMSEMCFLPIGTVGYNGSSYNLESPFQGTFDGQGHTIFNLHINKETGFGDVAVGMFKGIKNATIQNINFENLGVYGQYTTLIAPFYENVVVQNINILSGEIMGDRAASIVGESINNPGTNLIQNCINNANVYGSLAQLGGLTNDLAGIALGDIRFNMWGDSTSQAETKIINCINNGDVMHLGYTNGGRGNAIGIVYAATEVNSCVNNGNITGEYIASAIINYINNGDVIDCINSGTLKVLNFEYSGPQITFINGFRNGGNIKNCYNFGNMKGPKEFSAFIYLGVLIKDSQNMSIENCYDFSTQTVCQSDKQVNQWTIMYQAMFSGSNCSMTIKNCYQFNYIDWADESPLRPEDVGNGGPGAGFNFTPVPMVSGGINYENCGSVTIIDPKIHINEEAVRIYDPNDPNQAQQFASLNATNCYSYLVMNNKLHYSWHKTDDTFNNSFIGIKYKDADLGIELTPETKALIEYLVVPHSMFALGPNRADTEDAYSKLPFVV